MFTFEALGKKEQQEVHAGDIVAVVGVEDADIGDMVTSRENPVRFDPIQVEEPTMAIVFEHRPARSSAARATSWERASSRSA